MEGKLIEIALQIVVAVVLTLISVGGTYLTMKLAKNQQLAGIKSATEQVINAARITVEELQQTVVEALKAPGGKLTKEQIEDLGHQLLAKTYEKLSDPALKLLDAAAVDIEALVTGAGEAWIKSMKTETALIQTDVFTVD